MNCNSKGNLNLLLIPDQNTPFHAVKTELISCELSVVGKAQCFRSKV